MANEAPDGLEAEEHDSNKYEYLPKDSSDEEVVPKELLDFYLPVEVWVHAWSFLDFNTRQKICTLVSKTWLNQIRNSSSLSGEMKIFRSIRKKFEDFDNGKSFFYKLCNKTINKTMSEIICPQNDTL